MRILHESQTKHTHKRNTFLTLNIGCSELEMCAVGRKNKCHLRDPFSLKRQLLLNVPTKLSIA